MKLKTNKWKCQRKIILKTLMSRKEGAALQSEKMKYFDICFVCPHCGEALCLKRKLKDFTDSYCIYCGKKVVSAIKEALTLVEKED